MTERQINDIIEELTSISVGLECLMQDAQREYNNVEKLIGKFTVMLPDAESDTESKKELDEFLNKLFSIVQYLWASYEMTPSLFLIG